MPLHDFPADDSPVVTFGGVLATNVTRNGNTVTCTIPVQANGSVAVSVFGDWAEACGTFLYDAPAPLSDPTINPNTGWDIGGSKIIITVTGGGVVTSIIFGGVPAEFVQIGPGQYLVTVPPGAAGTVPVVITAGEESVTTSFTYTGTSLVGAGVYLWSHSPFGPWARGGGDG